MEKQVRGKVRQWGIEIGRLPIGLKNCITDVADVRVGHTTLDYPLPSEAGNEGKESKQGYACTGVTAILPHGGNLFREKVPAASYVLNGFGKTTGLVQIDELGTIESPIMLTNTLSVPAVTQGALRYMLAETPEIGDSASTINIVTAECNDGYLNSIRELLVTPEHALEALRNASNTQVTEGAVGAGKGMVCFGYKGGIGSSSRIVKVEGSEDHYTVGCLVLSNYGKKEEFQLDRYWPGMQDFHSHGKHGIHQENSLHSSQDESCSASSGPQTDGSIIIVLATDAPLSDRQLKRVAKRCGIGLGRTGSHFSHGSGDIVIAFSTVNRILHFSDQHVQSSTQLRDNHPTMNLLFTAAAEATEEAILNSLTQAETTYGRNGRAVDAFSFPEIFSREF